MNHLLRTVTRWARHTVADQAVRLPAPRPLRGPRTRPTTRLTAPTTSSSRPAALRSGSAAPGHLPGHLPERASGTEQATTARRAPAPGRALPTHPATERAEGVR